MQNPVRGGDRSCNGTNGSKIVPTDRPRANLPAADNHHIVRADAIQHGRPKGLNGAMTTATERNVVQAIRFKCAFQLSPSVTIIY